MAMLLKLLPYIAVVVIFFAGVAIGYTKGSASAQIKDAKQETTAIKKDGDNYDAIKLKDSQLSDPDFELRVHKFLRTK